MLSPSSSLRLLLSFASPHQTGPLLRSSGPLRALHPWCVITLLKTAPPPLSSVKATSSALFGIFNTHAFHFRPAEHEPDDSSVCDAKLFRQVSTEGFRGQPVVE